MMIHQQQEPLPNKPLLHIKNTSEKLSATFIAAHSKVFFNRKFCANLKIRNIAVPGRCRFLCKTLQIVQIHPAEHRLVLLLGDRTIQRRFH